MFPQRNDQSPTDDLGIIDLDNDDDEEDDLFDVDDDKLPVLKNIFSKKNRPNNGKSVAIGSRSQGGIMKIRPQGDPKSKAKKERTILQKPNSAQRVRQKKVNKKIKGSVLQSREEGKPLVIYDEDNLICDDFFIGRQRPQSGRVSR